MSAAPRRPGRRWLLPAVVAGGFLVRAALAARLPLADDEAYYWLWSRHLAWGYPDHPPAIGALTALGRILGGDAPWALRSVPVLLASTVPLLAYLLGRDLFDRATGERAALIAAALPVLAIGTAFAVPDSALGAFWLLALWSGWRALRDGGRWWAPACIAGALAVVTKLPGLYLGVGMAGALAGGSGAFRRALRDRWFYGGILLGAALIAPFLAWNAAHGWLTFRFAFEAPPWIPPRSIPVNLLLFAAAQLAYHGPAAVPLLGALLSTSRGAGGGARYLVWMSLPLLLSVAAAALWATAKPHWPSPAYLAAAVALAAVWPRGNPEAPRLRTRLRMGALVATAALTAVLAAAALLPSLLPLGDIFGRWEALTAAAAREVDRVTASGGRAFILTDGYQEASQIAYRLRERIVTTSPVGAFPLWHDALSLPADEVVYVETDGSAGARLLAGCADLRRGKMVDIAPARAATIVICRGFPGFP